MLVQTDLGTFCYLDKKWTENVLVEMIVPFCRQYERILNSFFKEYLLTYKYKIQPTDKTHFLQYIKENTPES